MTAENSLRNMFRYIQLRPPVALAPTDRAEINSETALARSFADRSIPERRELARQYLRRPPAGAVDAALLESLADVARTVSRVLQAEDKSVSIEELRKSLGKLPAMISADTVRRHHAALSDAILASYYASGEAVSAKPNTLTGLYKAHELLARTNSTDPGASAFAFLRRPVSLGRLARTSTVPVHRTQGSGRNSSAPTALELTSAIEELLNLDHPDALFLPSVDGEELGVSTGASVPFSLLHAAFIRVTSDSRATLSHLGIDPTRRSIRETIAALEAALPPAQAGSNRPSGTLEAPAPAHVQTSGIADLLVVKQCIKRYETTEIAHIENVMAGETRKRVHRMLTRHEEVAVAESERTTEEERELQTADRFELNKETEETIKDDSKLGFQLSVSGKYGPAVEFTSQATLEQSESVEKSAQNATKFAQEVIERSVSRIKDRVKKSRTVTMIREAEERNQHGFVNTTLPAEHIVGIYQFLDKVYEAQVFNYGLRQMFDFMIPEPASYLWHLQREPADAATLPSPPVPLSIHVASWMAVTSANYKALELLYNADAIPSPPSAYLTRSTSLNHGDGQGDEEGKPRSFHHLDIDVPAGYQPVRAKVSMQVLTDENPVLSLQIGHARRNLQFPTSLRHSWSNDLDVCQRTAYFYGLTDAASNEESKLGLDLYAYETASYALEIDIEMRRSVSLYREWQKQAYRTLVEAYSNKLNEYKMELEAARAQARADSFSRDFGVSPSAHLKQILNELKKHCISIVTGQWYDNVSSATGDPPPFPQFDLAAAAEGGRFARFFEQAFEWEHLQYVFYPYYWSRHDTWRERYLRTDADFVFQEFLQSGAARVVVPVRPGFELAVNHYLSTGELWNGEGDVLQIGDDQYVSIVDEIMSQTGAPGREVAVGDYWEVRLPTPLVLLKTSRHLPEWELRDRDKWLWSAVETPAEA